MRNLKNRLNAWWHYLPDENKEGAIFLLQSVILAAVAVLLFTVIFWEVI